MLVFKLILFTFFIIFHYVDYIRIYRNTLKDTLKLGQVFIARNILLF